MRDLHALRCPERDFTIFEKYMFVFVRQRFYGKPNLKTTSPIFMKLYTQLHRDLSSCLSTSGGNRPKGGAFVILLSEFFGML